MTSFASIIAGAGPYFFRVMRTSGSCPSRALPLRHAGARAQRGGVPETVDQRVGLTYGEPTAAGLLAAIDEWEASGCAFDAEEARRRAEALSLEVFRERILGMIREVVAVERGARRTACPTLESNVTLAFLDVRCFRIERMSRYENLAIDVVAVFRDRNGHVAGVWGRGEPRTLSTT